MSTENIKSEGLYYNVIDGTFRRRVNEDTPGATKREYETKDGGKGVKYEMVIDSLEGYVHGIGIYDGEFGRQLQIKLDPNEKGINPVIQFSVENAYGEDVLKKLPNVDFKKPLKLRPFAFTVQENGREVRGVELKQDDEKLFNFFFDPEKKEAINGYPVPDGDTDSYTKDDWKMYFLGARKFLITYFTENIRPRFEKEVGEQPTQKDAPKEEVQEDINPEDIPF